jgi:RHS repeat-associated protein
MHRMVTAPICTYSSNAITRAQSRAGEWNASFDFDVESITTATLLNIASTNESLADSSRSLCNSTGAFCRNQQYSITAVTTSAGAIAERYAYSAYGEPTVCDGSGSTLSQSAIGNRYLYTSREWDTTVGLFHFRARWMSPKTGRFMQRDPVGYLDSENLFEFLQSNPLARVDPSGLSGIDSISNAIARLAPALAAAHARYQAALAAVTAAAAKLQEAICSRSPQAIQAAQRALQQAQQSLSSESSALQQEIRNFLQVFGSHQDAIRLQNMLTAIRQNEAAISTLLRRLQTLGPKFNNVITNSPTTPGTCRDTAKKLFDACPKDLNPQYIRVWCKEGGPVCGSDGTVMGNDHVVLRCGNYVYDSFNRQGTPFDDWFKNLITNRLIENPTFCTEVLRSVDPSTH